MNPGRLRHRIVIQQLTETQDSAGQLIPAWKDLATVWAEKKHDSSREFFSVQKVYSEVTDLFIARHLPGVNTRMRVSYDGRHYDILGADDQDGRRRELYLICKVVS